MLAVIEGLGTRLTIIHVQDCQQCIVRGVGLGLGFGLGNKDQKKIKGTTKPLMAILDISPNNETVMLSRTFHQFEKQF